MLLLVTVNPMCFINASNLTHRMSLPVRQSVQYWRRTAVKDYLSVEGNELTPLLWVNQWN